MLLEGGFQIPQSCPVVFLLLPHRKPSVSLPEVPLSVQQMSCANPSVVNPLDGLQRSKLRMMSPEFFSWTSSPSKNSDSLWSSKPHCPAPQEGACLPPEETKCPLRGDKNEASGAWSQWGGSSLWDTQDMFFRILLGIVLWSDCGLILHLKKRMWRGGFPSLGRLLHGHPQFTETAPAWESVRTWIWRSATCRTWKSSGRNVDFPRGALGELSGTPSGPN